MTLVVGIKTSDSVIVAAETEEAAGYTAKRHVYKITQFIGNDWTVFVGGAGESPICDNAMRRLGRKIEGRKSLTEEQLADAIDDVLATVHDKYIDPVKNSEGIALIIGASLGNELHLISTHKRTVQFHDDYAYAGLGADLAIYFIDQLHDASASWEYAVKLASLVLDEVKDFTQSCSGGSGVCVLQTPPNPRWRAIGSEVVREIENHLHHKCDFIASLRASLRDLQIYPKRWGRAEDLNDYREEGEQ